MPVLHYSPVIGGLETWTQKIAEQLSDKAEIFVVTGKVYGQPKQEIKNGVNIFRTSLFFLKDLSYSSPFYIFATLPFIFFRSLLLIKKHRCNLCHCQGFLSGVLGYLFFKLLKIPYVVTVQRQENRNFLKTLIYKNAVCCIAASSYIKRYFEEIKSKNIEVIPNGIDLRKFENLDRQRSREKLGIKDEFLIMTVGRLEKVKGIEYLIQAVNIPNSKFQIPNSKLLIIGDGSERENLENLAKKLNLKERIKFLGEIPNEKIPTHLAAADCFVLPSVKEGFGIVLLEAMAAGIPIIATKVGGVPDLIEHGKTGILVESRSPQKITEAIYRIYSNPELPKNLTKNARNNLEKYNWQNIAEKVYENYISYSNLSA